MLLDCSVCLFECLHLLRKRHGGEDTLDYHYNDHQDHHNDPLDHHNDHQDHGHQGVYSVDKYMEVLYSVSANVQVKLVGKQIFKKKWSNCFCFFLNENLKIFLVAGFSPVHGLPDKVPSEECGQLQQEGMWN